MSNKYQELLSKVKDLDKQNRDFRDQHKQDLRTLKALKEKYNPIVLGKAKAKKLSKEIENLKDKISINEQAVKNLESKDELKLYKSNDSIKKLASEIIKDSTSKSKEQKAEHERLVQELAEIKTKLLKKIAEIGQVVKDNKDIARQANYASQFVEQSFNSRSLRINEHIGASQGIIYTTKKECDIAYKKGYDLARLRSRQVNSKGFYLELPELKEPAKN